MTKHAALCWSVEMAGAVIAALVCCLEHQPAAKPRKPTKYRKQRWAKLLGAMDDTPRLWKEIAKRAGLKQDSQVRSDLAELTRQRKVMQQHGSWGYVLCRETGGASDGGARHLTQGELF